MTKGEVAQFLILGIKKMTNIRLGQIHPPSLVHLEEQLFHLAREIPEESKGFTKAAKA